MCWFSGCITQMECYVAFYCKMILLQFVKSNLKSILGLIYYNKKRSRTQWNFEFTPSLNYKMKIGIWIKKKKQKSSSIIPNQFFDNKDCSVKFKLILNASIVNLNNAERIQVSMHLKRHD